MYPTPLRMKVRHVVLGGLDEIIKAGDERGAKIIFFYKGTPDDMWKNYGELLNHEELKLRGAMEKGYLEMRLLGQDDDEPDFTFLDNKHLHLTEVGDRKKPRKSWFISDIPFFFKLRYKLKVYKYLKKSTPISAEEIYARKI